MPILNSGGFMFRHMKRVPIFQFNYHILLRFLPSTIDFQHREKHYKPINLRFNAIIEILSSYEL